MYFYELHEGDDEVYSDVLLATETEIEPEEFFELVQSIRHRIQDTYDDDTLIEAIAVELERDHGFTFIADERLSAAVNVSTVEAENFLAAVGAGRRHGRGAGRRLQGDLAEFDPNGEPGRSN